MVTQVYRSLGLLLSLYILDTTATPPKYGVVVPEDPFKFVGDRLILLCNITNPAVREDSSWLFFQRVTKKSKGFLLPKRSIHRLNTKSIQLELPRIKIDDEGIYECFQQRDILGSSPRYIGRQKVEVEYSPKRVERIDCRVFNWESMKCNWSLGHDYNHPENVNVSLVWTTNRRQKSCPMMTHTSCEWPSGLYSHNHVYLMRISLDVVVGSQVLKRALSPMFTIRTGLHVEPAPIHEFQASEENSTCIGLIWGHLSPKRRKKYFVLEYRKADFDDWAKIELDAWAMTDMRVLVCGLIAFTRYTFRMSVLPFPEKSLAMSAHGYPSKWAYISARTREDVPSSSPPLCQSCYHQRKCLEIVNSSDCRMVRIYWREIPRSQRNGKIIKYSIRFQNEAAPFLHSYESKRVVNEVFQISNVKYEVQLRAATVKGFSSVPSLLTLPASDKKPLQPENFLVETNYEDTPPYVYYLSWASVLANPNNYTNIVVVWCERGKLASACKGNINWIHLPHETVTYELVLYRKAEVDIGIAVEAFDGKIVVSSGIKWASCIYQRHQKPNYGPRNVRWTQLQPNKGLKVAWDKSDCSNENVFVTEYSVSLCRTLDEIMCHEPTISQSTHAKTEVTFYNLVPGKKYLVRIWAMSSAGYGPSSEPIVKKVYEEKTEEFDSSFIIGFALVIVVILLFFCFISCLCCRNCSHAKEKVLKFHFWIKRHMKARKQPSTPPSRFQNRPLPEPPSDEKIYYGLSACMLNHGSKRPQSCQKSKNQGHMNGQDPHSWEQKTEQPPSGARNTQGRSSKLGFYSFYLKQNGGVLQEQFHRTKEYNITNIIGNSGYSLANHSSEVLENSKNTSMSRKKSTDNCLEIYDIPPCFNKNAAAKSQGYEAPIASNNETPISSNNDLESEKTEMLHHSRETLLSRGHSKKVVMGVGNKTSQKLTEKVTSPLLTKSEIRNQQKIPSIPKSTQTLPLQDSPPPFSAPPPPKNFQRRQRPKTSNCVKRPHDVFASASDCPIPPNVTYIHTKDKSPPLQMQQEQERNGGVFKAKPLPLNTTKSSSFSSSSDSSQQCEDLSGSKTEGAYQYLSAAFVNNPGTTVAKNSEPYHTLLYSSESSGFAQVENNNSSPGLTKRTSHQHKVSPYDTAPVLDTSATRVVSLSSELPQPPPAPAPSPVSERSNCIYYPSSASIESGSFVDDNDNYIQCPDENVKNRSKYSQQDSFRKFETNQTNFV